MDGDVGDDSDAAGDDIVQVHGNARNTRETSGNKAWKADESSKHYQG